MLINFLPLTIFHFTFDFAFNSFTVRFFPTTIVIFLLDNRAELPFSLADKILLPANEDVITNIATITNDNILFFIRASFFLSFMSDQLLQINCNIIRKSNQ